MYRWLIYLVIMVWSKDMVFFYKYGWGYMVIQYDFTYRWLRVLWFTMFLILMYGWFRVLLLCFWYRWLRVQLVTYLGIINYVFMYRWFRVLFLCFYLQMFEGKMVNILENNCVFIYRCFRVLFLQFFLYRWLRVQLLTCPGRIMFLCSVQITVLICFYV